MKKILFILLLCIAVAAAAQSIPDNLISRRLKEDPGRAGTNVHNFEFGPIHDTPAPKGYKPFYISHYGRHGARTNGDGHRCVRLAKQLEVAEADGALTPDGEYVLGITREVIKRHNGMKGRLTEHGRWEHAQLAEHMYKRYPEVFRKGSKKISAVASMVPRCIVSMTAFTNRLMALQKDLDIDVDTGERFMDYIGKAATDDMVKRARKVSDSLSATVKPDTAAMMAVLLKNPADAHKYFKSAQKACTDMFDVAKATEALEVEGKIYDYFSFKDLYHWAESSSMFIYYTQGNSDRFGEERLERSKDLIDDIISRADKAIESGEKCADLRFGHDWPFVGLVSYFGLEGVSRRMNIETARNNWDASLYTPFAANLQIIFYKAKGKDVLVKFLVHEKETLIPELTAVKGPYYRWDDVKAMCRKALNERFK